MRTEQYYFTLCTLNCIVCPMQTEVNCLPLRTEVNSLRDALASPHVWGSERHQARSNWFKPATYCVLQSCDSYLVMLRQLFCLCKHPCNLRNLMQSQWNEIINITTYKNSSHAWTVFDVPKSFLCEGSFHFRSIKKCEIRCIRWVADSSRTSRGIVQREAIPFLTKLWPYSRYHLHLFGVCV